MIYAWASNTPDKQPLKYDMSDIKKVIEGLELIETVIPSYKHARHKGITDDEAETMVNWALEQAIILLEQLRRAMCGRDAK